MFTKRVFYTFRCNVTTLALNSDHKIEMKWKESLVAIAKESRSGTK